MAKMTRERAVKEKRALKQERKDERRELGHEHPDVDDVRTESAELGAQIGES